MVFACILPPTNLTFLNYFQDPGDHFNSTQSQESKSEVRANEFYAAMRMKTHLVNDLYLVLIPYES